MENEIENDSAHLKMTVAMWREVYSYTEKYQENFLCAYIGGSRAEGISNSTSDVDIIIIKEALEPAEIYDYSYCEGIRIQCRVINRSQIDQIGSKLKDSDDRLYLTDDELETIYRFVNGFLIKGQKKWSEISSDIPTHRVQHSRIRSAFRDSINGFEDFIGMYSSDQLMCAGQAGNLTATCLMECYLAIYGESYPSIKWVNEKYRRSRHLLDDDICEVYEDIFSFGIHTANLDCMAIFHSKVVLLYYKVEAAYLQYLMDYNYV